MLSILIPTYNDICTTLIHSLHAQATALGVAFEIILADDASPRPEVRRANETIASLAGCRYVQLQANLGRAAIRNLLVSEARGGHLLFLDSDVQVVSDNFLQRYYEVRQEADIVCGSLAIPQAIQAGCELRHLYEQAALPRRTASWRSAHPFEAFTVFNTLMKREVFDELSFDESCREYGYEDALLGVMAEQAGFSILHIDNPLIHLGEDPNAIFLEKTEAALRTLSHLGEPMQSRAAISRFAQRHPFLCRLNRLFFRLFQRPLRRNLLSHQPSLTAFKLYKLGYYWGVR